ncbi:rifamycin-inactivating phosphotransferase [Actinoplanes sp. NPDC048988]|uniref:rifamycin-inactivating phosphotransferase n=1 Tax=Actinoplanes sp. NPDC048988 TaxID=3363901 RepID=UPI003715ACBA
MVDLADVDRGRVGDVGGKGAHLGELLRVDGVRVPEGFCVTTAAFESVVRERLDAGDELRRAVQTAAMPDELVAAIAGRVEAGRAYAVRSSATSEDSAAASFAGQHDTYLNVVGLDGILDRVRRCWGSLFTERAVAYRLRAGADRDVRMAVVVQRMVVPRAAGIMFTADPVNGNRRVVSIDAGFGLGEALVSGLVHADVYKVRDGVVLSKTIGAKRLAIRPRTGGGTVEEEISPERRKLPALSDAEIVRLAELGRRIEAHFGRPQDIEWCLDDDGFAIVQSRPITTLFPVPVAPDDENRVYVSVGHQQMMTEAMRPLGLSVWKLTSPGNMVDAGGRLFVDATARLGPAFVAAFERSDPLTGGALRAVAERDFVTVAPDDSPHVITTAPEPIDADPAIVAELIAQREASLATLKDAIRGRTGAELLDFVIADVKGIRQILFDPRNMPAIMAGMRATWWLDERFEKGVADTLTLAAPNNVTSEMGLALLDVADVVRADPRAVALLEESPDDLDRLPEAAREAIRGYLDAYGMRCVGEIDITRPRWSEDPGAIVPMILSNVRNAAPGEHARRVEEGRRKAREKEREVLSGLPEAEAAETKRMIDQLRTFAGYREYPKYHLVSRYFVYKKALLAEAARLVAAGVITRSDDIYYLSLEELSEVVRTQRADHDLIGQRRAAFASYRSLVAPRVLTSEGEAVTGSYRTEGLPPGALAGLPVSAGTVEGRARVVADMAGADFEPGDILVTAYTDPSWTPAFVQIAGLVTEVGGQMTHGAVIAREYGLPAVVGVENATRLIEDGQRIRVHGTDGYVEIVTP